MNRWVQIDLFLNKRRMQYALITGAILWSAWMLSSLLGSGNMDRAGQVIGTDYLQFYSASLTVRQGHSADLYNFKYQSQLEQTIAGQGLQSFHAFITPPFLAWLYIPFTFLPYVWSFLAWSLLGLIFLWLSIRLLAAERRLNTFRWSLTWFPIFAAISFGQNSLLILLLFSITYWFWRQEKPFLAGLMSSLLLFKPQMLLGIVILWLLDWRKSWKSLLGMCLGGTILAGLCFIFSPEASKAYIDLAHDFLPGMIYQEQFPLWNMDSLRGFWALLLPGHEWLTEGLSLLLSGFGIIGFFFLWRKNRAQNDLLFAGAVCLTIWITPHAMIYDWSILLIPAIIFWQAVPHMRWFWKPVFALIWLATFLSGPLTVMQLKILPFALQISLPILFWVYMQIYKQNYRSRPTRCQSEIG
jgi:alpha-1,2-mannosyltransferase